MNAKTSKFKASSLATPSVIPYSDEPAKSAGRKFAHERSWKAIGPAGMAPDAQKQVVTKANLPKLPSGGTKSHPGLSAKSEPAPATYGAGSAQIKAPKSGEKNLSNLQGLPVKWHKQGYDKDAPASLPSGSRLAKKWELS